MEKKLAIFGAAESGRLACYYFERDGGRKVTAFVVDDEFLQEDVADGLPVIRFSEAARQLPPQDYDIHVAVAWGAANSIRQRKFDACRAAGYRLASYVSTRASVWPDLVHGENCFIVEHSSIQPAVRLGSNVLVGTGTRIAHATIIGDHVSFASNVCLGGNCEIGERGYLGLGAIVRDHCKIGADSIITMGASATKDLPPRSVVLAPASVIADPESADFVRQQSFPDPAS